MCFSLVCIHRIQRATEAPSKVRRRSETQKRDAEASLRSETQEEEDRSIAVEDREGEKKTKNVRIVRYADGHDILGP